jgi:hypothetical protein
VLTVLRRLKIEVRCFFSVVGEPSHDGVSLQENALFDDCVGGVDICPWSVSDFSPNVLVPSCGGMSDEGQDMMSPACKGDRMMQRMSYLFRGSKKHVPEDPKISRWLGQSNWKGPDQV